MDVQNLLNKRQELIEYMESSGYSANYIHRLKLEIEHIVSEATSKNWASYADIYSEYTHKPDALNYLGEKHALLGIIEDFDIKGQFPTGRPRQKRGKYQLLSEEFKTVIDYYCEVEKKRGIKDQTIYVSSQNTAGLFYDLQTNGISQLSEITEESIISSFIRPDGSLRRGCSFMKNVRMVFKACLLQNSVEFQRILAFLPEFRKQRKNIQYLTPDESEKLRQTLTDSDSPLSLRDRAIGALAFYTGMRSCDIAGLTLGSIDWDNDIISVKQQKTGSLCELPLKAVVGNTIYDYLITERPQNECDNVFLTMCGPIRRMESSGMRPVAKKIMKAANIRQSAGDRKGLHIFRHRVATQLLQNDVPRPVISRALGHDSPESLEPYLSTDFKHLKECALSISKFQVAEGVFGDA